MPIGLMLQGAAVVALFVRSKIKKRVACTVTRYKVGQAAGAFAWS